MTIEDPVARLSAGLDRDEQLARAATELPKVTPRYPEKRPSWEPEEWAPARDDVRTVNGAADPLREDGGTRSRSVAEHIARHDPAREFPEVALKRLILEEHTPLTVKDFPTWPGAAADVCAGCSFLPSPQTDAEPEYVSWPCDYIQALQAIYQEKS